MAKCGEQRTTQISHLHASHQGVVSHVGKTHRELDKAGARIKGLAQSRDNHNARPYSLSTCRV